MNHGSRMTLISVITVLIWMLKKVANHMEKDVRAEVLTMHNYFYHLYKNWCVAFHALWDFFAHFIHGLLPFIKIKHHQPVKNGGLKTTNTGNRRRNYS